VEELVSHSKTTPTKEATPRVSYPEIQKHLEKLLGTKVRISANKVTIAFQSHEQLNDLMQHIH
jgi:chemotaxis protein CheY-P-specific phosphatase CheC